jgi:hypothetical protein
MQEGTCSLSPTLRVRQPHAINEHNAIERVMIGALLLSCTPRPADEHTQQHLQMLVVPAGADNYVANQQPITSSPAHVKQVSATSTKTARATVCCNRSMLSTQRACLQQQPLVTLCC